MSFDSINNLDIKYTLINNKKIRVLMTLFLYLIILLIF